MYYVLKDISEWFWIVDLVHDLLLFEPFCLIWWPLLFLSWFVLLVKLLIEATHQKPVVIIDSIINIRLWLMIEWSSLVADELVCYCLPYLYWLSAQRTVPFTLIYTVTVYAIQSRLRCWIVDFVFPFSSSEPFALGCIHNNFSYASPVRRLCVCVCVCMFIASAAVNWFNVFVTVRWMCVHVKIATSHAGMVSTHQYKHKSGPQSAGPVYWTALARIVLDILAT